MIDAKMLAGLAYDPSFLKQWALFGDDCSHFPRLHLWPKRIMDTNESVPV